MQPLDRRALLRLGLFAGAAMRAFAEEPGPDARPLAGDTAPLPSREFGRTGRRLPLLGLGCFPLGNLASEVDAVALVRRAFDSGARYFDTAPSYADGASERRVGIGLKGLPREELYVSTKTLARDGDEALAELERSLERLGLEYVDCVQVHELRGLEDLERALAQGGVVKALERAREKKKLRWIGVTCHKDPAFARAALERYEFASALVPVNPLDLQHRSFVKELLPFAAQRKVGLVAMKIFAGGALLREGTQSRAAELVRWALAQEGVGIAVPGAETGAHWDEARAAAVAPAPDAKESEDIVRRAGEHRGASSEWYKNP